MMKKLIAILAVVFITTSAFSQAPQFMSYQAVIRNSSNALIANTAVGMQISILQGSSSGTAVYVERQTPTTNVNGLATISIGSGSILTGSFASINWATGPYFIKTETDPAGGSAYGITGTSQLQSVPYALFAASTGASSSSISGTINRVIKFTGTNTGGDSRLFDDGTNVGIGTITPTFPLDVTGNTGTVGNFTNTIQNADYFGVNGTCNNTPYYGIGVTGIGGFKGVVGSATLAGIGSRIAVQGLAQNGASSNYGIYGNATGGATSYGVYGNATGATTNWAGFFEGGNVYVQNNMGIGTQVPEQNLSVNGGMNVDLASTNNGSLNPGNGLSFGSASGEGIASKRTSGGNQNGLDFYTGYNNRMCVTSNGYVGIGTTLPVNIIDAAGNTATVGNFINTNASVSSDYIGVIGKCNNSPFFGYGTQGFGGFVGAYGEASLSGTGSRYGLYGMGENGTSNNYGVYGSAYGGVNAYGIYSTATSGTTNYAGYFAGNVYTTGTYQSSDRKLKNDIKPLNDALSIINQLKPSVYTFKINEYKQMNLPEGLQYGLIADEVQQVLPGAVKKAVQPAEYKNHDEKKGAKISDEVEFNAVNYTEIIPILIGAVKEQQRIIEGMKKEIELLKQNRK